MYDAFHPNPKKGNPPKGVDTAPAKGGLKTKGKPERNPGDIPENRIPIYDHAGNMRGHVTPAATGATVARFLGRHGADLSTKDGRQAWIGHKPPPPPPPPTIIMGDGSAPPNKAADPKQSKGSAKPKAGKPPKGM